MSISSRLLSVHLVITLFAGLARAQGGPPLVTDDPGTPGDAHWEINTALAWSPSAENSIVQLPLLDLNYGYGEHVQLNLNTSIVDVNEYGVGTAQGGSTASVAVKWRLLDEERLGAAVSIYPRVDFHHSLSSDNALVNTPGSRCFFPVELSKEFGKFGLNPELGYAVYSQFPSEWSYGLAMSYEVEKEKEVLFEVHGRNRVGTTDQEILYNLGTRHGLSANTSFLGSFGRTVNSYSDSYTSWNFYFGIQLRI